MFPCHIRQKINVVYQLGCDSCPSVYFNEKEAQKKYLISIMPQ